MNDKAPPLQPADHELLDENAIIRATFESAPDALVVVDRNARVVAMNACFAQLWQLPPAVAARRDVTEMRDHVARQLKNPLAYLQTLPADALTGQAAVLTEFEHVDGRCFERQVSPLGHAGFPGAVVARWRDISPRRRAEQALQQAQLRWAAIFEHALEAILLADDHGRYVDANPAACKLLGRAHETLLGQSVADVVDLGPSDFASVWAAFLQQGTASGQVTLRRPDGKNIVARFNSVARVQPGVHLSVLSDVTEEVQARQREIESSAQMDMAMANADIVFWRVDLMTDRISSTNEHWLERSLGYAVGDIAPGMAAWEALVHPDDRDRRGELWLAHLEGRCPTYEAEFRVRHKDGRWVWLLTRGRVIERDADGRPLRVVGSRIDITQRKLAEQQLQQQAFTDGLTGTLNRRRFLELAEVEMSRSRRHDLPIALVMIDLDHFKSVNDQHGHAGGDAVLRAFVQTAQTVVRTSDLFGRVGGEEFAVLLPQTDLDGAAALAQRLRALVHAHPVPLAGGMVDYSVSMGVAARRSAADDATTVESLMLAADAALYRAKGEGRDRVLLAERPWS